MDTLDEEYLDIFGDEKVYKKVLELFDKIDKKKCNNTKTSVSNGEKETTSPTKCLHKNRYENGNGLYSCKDCGTEVEIYDFEPEWRYYRFSDNGSSKDPSRCHNSSGNNRGLEKLFSDHGIEVHLAIRAQVEKKYRTVVGKETVRGKGRKSIVAACLFHTFKEFGEFRTSDYVRNLFDLTKKNMSDGLTKYYKAFPNDRINTTSAEDLIPWVLQLTGVHKEHKEKIKSIAKYLEGTSRLLKRSSPQSVASSIVYFYLCLNPEYKAELGLTKNKFSEKALLSDITVGKLVKEIARVSKSMIQM